MSHYQVSADNNDAPTYALTSRKPSVHPEGFNLIRIVAALAVVVGHAMFLVMPSTQLAGLGFGDTGWNLPRVAVTLFFAVSGYLVTASWQSSGSARSFAAKRLRRIYPAALVMVVATAFVIGPLVTTSESYFGDLGVYEYAVRNAFIIPYDYYLPGVVTKNPVPQVNGVLWTLSLEVLCYLGVAVLGRIGFLKRVWPVATIAALLVIGGWPELYSVATRAQVARIGEILTMVGVFFAASALRMSGFKGNWRWMTGALLGIVITQLLPGLPLSAPAALLIVIFAVSFGNLTLSLARVITRWGDPSYGIYIWGFVISQLLIREDGHLSMLEVSLWSAVLAAVVGYASWHVVEKRWLSPSRRMKAE